MNLKRSKWRTCFLICDFSSFHQNNFRDTISWECVEKDDFVRSCFNVCLLRQQTVLRYNVEMYLTIACTWPHNLEPKPVHWNYDQVHNKRGRLKTDQDRHYTWPNWRKTYEDWQEQQGSENCVCLSKNTRKFWFDLMGFSRSHPNLTVLANLARHRRNHWCCQFLASILDGLFEFLVLRDKE